MAACIQDGGVTQKMTAWEFFPIKCRRYPQDGGVPTNDGITHKTVLCLQDSGVHTRWRRYQQDGGFTHKMPTRWQQCRVSASFTHKMAACIQDDGVTHKKVLCLQDGGIPTKWQCFCEFYPAKQLM